MTEALDLAYMQMAYGLAEKARGRSSPNPLVGSVIVREGAIIGHGYHEEAGKPHAEIIALRRAGRRSRGATIYVTLEPCVHWGRTPPCVDAVIEAGLKRALISAYDPNPIVRRNGVRRLRQAGLDVTVGLLEEKNARLNEIYAKYITRKIPFVTLKAALTLDGKTATRTGDSKWISSAGTRDYVHLLRGEYDALMVGINTLIRDDPLLTVRHPTWGAKKITRVILDPHLRFPRAARILTTLGNGPIIVFALEGASPAKAAALTRKGVEIVPLGKSWEADRLAFVLAELGKREIAGLLVEGGNHLQTAFIESGLADKLVLTVSPKLIGGREASGFFSGEGVRRMRDSLPVENLRAFRLGNDLVLEGYF
jgi:diaminohydroxyphosphoribosylaminopyrimidine deaminase/5-amino-6-(5-phosphoribosylamino)uracil reductase